MVEANPTSSASDGKIKIAIIGATGAVGREVVQSALNNERVETLFLLVRRKLEEWDAHVNAEKITYIMKENFDSFDDCRE